MQLSPRIAKRLFYEQNRLKFLPIFLYSSMFVFSSSKKMTPRRLPKLLPSPTLASNPKSFTTSILATKKTTTWCTRRKVLATVTNRRTIQITGWDTKRGSGIAEATSPRNENWRKWRNWKCWPNRQVTGLIFLTCPILLSPLPLPLWLWPYCVSQSLLILAAVLITVTPLLVKSYM